MKIILLIDIAKTGQKGQILEVSEGFGRHLIKQKQASFATPELVQKLENQKKKEKELSGLELKKIQDIAAKLDGEEIEVIASHKDGLFYAAIGANEIVKIIKNKFGLKILGDQIKIRRPIKEPGVHHITITFKHGLEAEVSLLVT